MIFTAELVFPSGYADEDGQWAAVRLGDHEVARFEPQARIYPEGDAGREWPEEELAAWVRRLLDRAGRGE
jgi:hypothetical protein